MAKVKHSAPWNVETMDALFDDCAAAKGNAESLTAKIAAMDAEIAGKISSIPIASADALGAVKIGSGIHLEEDGTISVTGGGGGGGTTDYRDLDYKPQINSVTLTGDKSSADLGLASASDVAAKADAATTLAGYGITDAKISNGVITLGSNTITPLTQHQDISGKADKATTLAGYGITDAKIQSGTITLGSQAITPLTQHQDISGKADKATTIAGYGITDAKITSGTITLGSQSITPLTQHQDISGKADKVEQEKDRAALIEIVDSGAKNLSNWYTGTAAADSTTIATAIPITYRSGDFVFSYNTSLTTGSITIGFRDASNTLVGSVQVDNSTKVKVAAIPSGAAKFNVFASKAGTYSNFMICSKAAWDISHAFQPYRPSYQELCDRVLNGGAS